MDLCGNIVQSSPIPPYPKPKAFCAQIDKTKDCLLIILNTGSIFVVVDLNLVEPLDFSGFPTIRIPSVSNAGTGTGTGTGMATAAASNTTNPDVAATVATTAAANIAATIQLAFDSQNVLLDVVLQYNIYESNIDNDKEL